MTEEFKFMNELNKINDMDESYRVPLGLVLVKFEEFIKRLKETIAEGVKRNNVLPLDWCNDRIDKLSGDLK